MSGSRLWIPRLTRLKPASSQADRTRLGGAGGVGLEGDLATRGEGEALAHLVEHPGEPGGVDEAGRPAAHEDGVQLQPSEPRGEGAQLGAERLDVLRLPVAAGHGDEVAVLAAPLAEGDVDVEGADLARGGDRLRALHRGQVWAHRPDGPAMPWRCRLRKNIRVMAGIRERHQDEAGHRPRRSPRPRRRPRSWTPACSPPGSRRECRPPRSGRRRRRSPGARDGPS